MSELREVRWTLALSCVVLLVVVGVRHRSESSRRTALLDAWIASPVAARHPDTTQRAERAPTAFVIRQRVAQALVADSLELRQLAALPPERAAAEIGAIPDRLGAAQIHAVELLRERPASIEGWWILGASRLLARLYEPQLGTMRGHESWEAPLRQALRLSPTAVEPERFLAVSFLSRWHGLTDEQRSEGRRLLRSAFAEPATLDRLLAAWMAVASTEDLWTTLPDEAYAWQKLQGELVRQNRWAEACEASDRHRAALERELAARLNEAQAREAGGDLAGASRLYREVLRGTVPSSTHRLLFSEALRRLAAGPMSPSLEASLSAWAAWALPLWLRDHPSLELGAFRRLSGLDSLIGPEGAALAALAADDLGRAERLERASDRLWSESWGPYLLGKAKLYRGRGQLEEAEAALDLTHREIRHSPLFRRLRSDPDPLPIDSLSPRSWQASDWTWQDGRPSLDLEVPPGTWRPSLELTAPDTGGALRLQLDGRDLGCFGVASTQRLDLPPLEGGLHYLTFEGWPTPRLLPGRFELTASEPTALR